MLVLGRGIVVGVDVFIVAGGSAALFVARFEAVDAADGLSLLVPAI